MKKILAVLMISLFAVGLLQAQESTFGKGDKVANLGIGLLSGLYSGSGYTSKMPPVSLSFEYGIVDDVLEVGSIGIGGYVGYASAKWESDWGGGVWGWKYTNFIIGARGSFHYPLVDKLDTYAGVMLGYNVVSVKDIGTVQVGYSASGSEGVFNAYVGGRYYFNDNFAAMAELGTGIAYLNIGIAYKL